MNGTVVIAEGALKAGALGTFYAVHRYVGDRPSGMSFRLDVEHKADRRTVSSHHGSIEDAIGALRATAAATRKDRRTA